ncbi:MAG TPA: YezD family protein [Patescibacteria group bacterium]|nr:YezD family protein [Patescibacteria group bacterium]
MARMTESKVIAATVNGKNANDPGLKEALDLIVQSVDDIFFGSVSLVVQDSKIIQIEKLEKIRLCEAGGRTSLPRKTECGDAAGFRTRVAAAVDGLQYGKILIQIQSRQVVQIERTEKYRVNKLAGLYGDGI